MELARSDGKAVRRPQGACVIPFVNTAEIEEFRFVNEKDPLGEYDLNPRSWNLEPDPENPGHNRLMPVGHPRESVWKFARRRSQADDDLITRKVAKTQIKYNTKQARKEGRNYSPSFEQETLMSGLMALITTMSRGWSGPEFVVSDGQTDEQGRPSQYRGKLAPCTAYWISQRDPVELRAVELFLQDLYEPEGPEEAQFFQGASGGVAGPSGTGESAEDIGQPDRTVSVPSVN